MSFRTRPRPVGREERGQILVVFVLSLIVILALGALLFDGGNALVQRRKLQDAGDAAALAAANVIQSGTPRGCSMLATNPPGPPRVEVQAAALSVVAATLPGFDMSKVSVTCPAGWDNQAVQVDVGTGTASIFANAAGGGPLKVATTSAALNGAVGGSTYSILLLDPSNPSWPSGRRGCPAALISGGPTLIFDGSAQINSACPAANGGALATNGSSASITMNNGAVFRIVGGYSPAALTITPAPLTGQAAVKDPLAGLPPMPVSSLPLRSASKLTLSNTAAILNPGVYRGGIELKNSSIALLKPGVYVMDGGGFAVGAQASVFSIPVSVTNPLLFNPLTWLSTCVVGTGQCGILLYNTGTTSTFGQVDIAAGATVRLRAYDPVADASGLATEEYRNLLIWQNGSPAPTNSWAQPIIRLNGGGSVSLSGSVYAPGAKVEAGGGSGGAGGNTDWTVQFIVWDVEFRGNSHFHFFFNDDEFARPLGYGLVR